MKRIFFVLILIGAFMPLIAQEGVKFENLTLREALNKAEEIDKQVFVDCYTSWCGPCKNMTENIFPQKAVGDYFNANFVCVKYDMEKGEGPEIAKQYEIRAYPTFLILAPDGTLVHKIVGARDAKGIIQSAMEALDENKALYEWNYQKQLLHIQGSEQSAADIFSEDYLLSRPILKALRSIFFRHRKCCRRFWIPAKSL